MNKHAYMIIAHNKIDQLKILLNLIDDVRNDIYLLIDEKFKIDVEEVTECIKNAKIEVFNNLTVNWGGYSIINAELFLLSKATQTKHKYYHLLSGVDLPLKSQEYIHNFFENETREFISFQPDAFEFAKYKTQYYHPFVDNPRFRNSILRRGLRKVIVEVQKAFKINRLKNEKIILRYGSQWFSITHDLAIYVLEQKDYIEKLFKNTLACDEVFLQSIAYNSEFRKKLATEIDDNNGNLRYIDWKRKEGNSPYTFKNDDYNDLIESELLFARKFDIDTDNEIIEKIRDHVLNGE